MSTHNICFYGEWMKLSHNCHPILLNNSSVVLRENGIPWKFLLIFFSINVDMNEFSRSRLQNNH